MNTHTQAKKELVKLGWSGYLGKYLEILETNKVNNTRVLESDKVLQDYISFNLPLCLGDRVRLADMLSHEDRPKEELDVLLLKRIISIVDELEIEHPYGIVDGIDAFNR